MRHREISEHRYPKDHLSVNGILLFCGKQGSTTDFLEVRIKII